MFNDDGGSFDQGYASEPNEFMTLPPNFGRDLANNKDISDKMMNLVVGDDPKQRFDNPMFRTNTIRSGYNIFTAWFIAMQQQGLPLSFNENAFDVHGVKLINDVAVNTDESFDLHALDSELFKKFYIPAQPQPGKAVELGEATTLYSRMAMIISHGYISPKDLRAGSQGYGWNRALFPELSDQEFEVMLPRLFMTNLIALSIEEPSRLRNDWLGAKERVRAYEKLAERKVRLIGLEEFHGMVSGVVKATLEEHPEFRPTS